nr:MAG TPA: glycoside hydrolase family protein [Caudoviricetes sp.]
MKVGLLYHLYNFMIYFVNCDFLKDCSLYKNW